MISASKFSIACFLNAVDCIQTSRIPDKRQALRYYLDQKIFIVPNAHVGRRVAGKLRLAAALCRKETKGDHLPLTVV